MFDSVLGYVKKIGSLKTAVIIFAALALFILVFEHPGSTASNSKKKQLYFIPFMMNVSDVDYIQVSRDAETFVMIKEEGDWILKHDSSYPIDEIKVHEFLSVLHDLQIETKVSNNTEKQVFYGVDEALGKRVILKQSGDQIADFYVGKMAGLASQYVRRYDSNEVFQVAPPVGGLILPQQDWLDLNVLSFIPSQVNRIKVVNPYSEVVLENKEGGWKMIQPEENEINEESVMSFLETVIITKAFDFSDLEMDIEDPIYKLSLRMNDDSVTSFFIGEKTPDDYYLMRNTESTFTYLVEREVIDRLFSVDFNSAS